MSEIKEYLDKLNECWRLFDKAAKPLCDKLYKSIDNARLVETKPTLSEILTEGFKRIDDAVEAVIARHEKEIDDIARHEKEIDDIANNIIELNKNKLYNDLAISQLYQQRANDQRNAISQGYNQFNPQLSGLQQSQNNFGGRWI